MILTRLVPLIFVAMLIFPFSSAAQDIPSATDGDLIAIKTKAFGSEVLFDDSYRVEAYRSAISGDFASDGVFFRT